MFSRLARNSETATFGMGCFWGPDSRFGSLPGVIRTRTGYAGGTSENPDYRHIGDHTETIQVDFDPSILSYEEIVHLFWNSHDAIKDRFYKERQYLSLLICEDERQQEIALKLKSDLEMKFGRIIQTEIQLRSPFYLAEDHHQKYYLKRFHQAMETILPFFSDFRSFVDSTLAARLNGFVKEYSTLKDLKEDYQTWGLSEEENSKINRLLETIRW